MGTVVLPGRSWMVLEGVKIDFQKHSFPFRGWKLLVKPARVGLGFSKVKRIIYMWHLIIFTLEFSIWTQWSSTRASANSAFCVYVEELRTPRRVKLSPQATLHPQTSCPRLWYIIPSIQSREFSLITFFQQLPNWLAVNCKLIFKLSGTSSDKMWATIEFNENLLICICLKLSFASLHVDFFII